ncbi:MAG: lipid-A-disaccharide synthase [Bryobacterales bacterium]|nr:lipid-A-disaccharide synthase [Bryobacterales bacterium]MDE0627855.1 lipid-A-disaccharide synthase [Bryobacterales bacterium]
MRILVSAGEASGDRYAAGVVSALRRALPDASYFGCGGPRMREAGVEAIVRTEDLSVVGLFEVLRHIPRIHGLYRKLVDAAARLRPDLAILTDAPDFHLRLASRLRDMGVPVAYYVAPQVWAWRRRRIGQIRRLVDHLLVIFPFEEEFFRRRGVEASFVGHPLSELAGISVDRDAFFAAQTLNPDDELVALLPGSRKGESLRHLPALEDAASRLVAEGVRQFVLPASATTGKTFFEAHWKGPPVRIVDRNAQNCVGHADVALVASGSATVEAAILGTPMVTFYKLAWPSYCVARMLVDVPHYSMVNLLAGKKVIREYIQHECTGTKLAGEAIRLLRREADRCRMIQDLARVRALLRTEAPASERAAQEVVDRFKLVQA